MDPCEYVFQRYQDFFHVGTILLTVLFILTELFVDSEDFGYISSGCTRDPLRLCCCQMLRRHQRNYDVSLLSPNEWKVCVCVCVCVVVWMY